MTFEKTLAMLIETMRKSGLSSCECYGVAEALVVMTRSKMLNEIYSGGKELLKKREAKK